MYGDAVGRRAPGEVLVVGVIGLGGMGSGIAATLLRNGFELVVHDLDRAKVDAAVAAGAAAGAGVADVAERAQTVVLSLPSSAVTVRVLEALVPIVSPDTVVIDMGTTIARETRRLAAAFAARGATLLDAPVSGGTVGAAKGDLYVFVGGDRAAFDREHRLLSALGGARLTWCGTSGAGQVAKAVNQLCMGLVDAAYLEAVAFGVRAGVDAATLAEAVGGDGGFRLRLREVAERVVAGEGDGNDVKFAEFAYFLDEADRIGFPAPMLTALHDFMKQFPSTHRDNMGRPYPPLWSALAVGGEAAPT